MLSPTQADAIKEESTEVESDLFLPTLPEQFTDVEIKREEIKCEEELQQQSSKRRRVSDNSSLDGLSDIASENLFSDLDLFSTRVRRPSSSASSGHGTLSEDSEGGLETPLLTSARASPSYHDLGIGSEAGLETPLQSSARVSPSHQDSGIGPEVDSQTPLLSSAWLSRPHHNLGGDSLDHGRGIGGDSLDHGSLASLNCLNSSLDEMIQASSHQHNRPVQVSVMSLLSQLYGPSIIPMPFYFYILIVILSTLCLRVQEITPRGR